MKRHTQRPVILYVEELDFKPAMPEFGYRVTVLDIEVTKEMAERIVQELQERLKDDRSGAIRFRLSGTVSLP